MASSLMKTLLVLFLVLGALGCDPYRRHHRYRDSYASSYYGGYGPYASPYDGRYGRRDWDDHYRHRYYDRW